MTVFMTTKRLVILLLAVSLLLVAQTFDDSNDPKQAYGAMHSESGVTNNTSGVPIKIAGTYTLSGLEVLFDEPVDGRLRYLGVDTMTFEFEVHFSLTSNTNNVIITLMIAKNGSIIAESSSERKIGTGTDVGAMSIGYLVSLATNDYLEVFMDSASGDPTITTSHLTLIAMTVN